MRNGTISGYLSGKMSGKALAARAFESLWGKRKVPAFVSKAGTYYGGGGGNRTPVRKLADIVFSERSHDFGIPLAGRLAAGCRLR